MLSGDLISGQEKNRRQLTVGGGEHFLQPEAVLLRVRHSTEFRKKWEKK